jgi:hypothetical protein
MGKPVTFGTVCIVCLIALLTTDRNALGQAGSIGGTIGKTDKSVSGGDVTRPRTSRGHANSGKHASQCQTLAGVWTANGWWNAIYGRGDVVLNSDGSAQHNSGIPGTWRCNNRHFEMHWKEWADGEGTLSDDGNTITFSDGGLMTRGR